MSELVPAAFPTSSPSLLAPLTDPAGGSPLTRLRSFAESFTFGSTGSICSPDYAPFFDAFAGTIATACQQFEPPG